MCLDAAFFGCCPHDAQGRYLSGAAGDLQRAVNVLLGLVMAAHEPEEEAGIVQGSPAGCLADFLQAALKFLNCFSVWESKTEEEGDKLGWGGLSGPASPRSGPPSTHGAGYTTAQGLGTRNTGPCDATGAAQPWNWVCWLRFTFSPLCPAVCWADRSNLNPPPQAHNPFQVGNL